MEMSAALIEKELIRPLKRREYDRLAADGYFEDERVELLFGMVVETPPIDQAHIVSTNLVRKLLESALGDRATVLSPSAFAASDISEPAPDVMVVPPDVSWDEHPSTAYLVVEVARRSLRRDRGLKAMLYGESDVEEYWIVNHVDGVIEVFRDRSPDGWRSHAVHGRGERVAMARFPDVTIAVDDVLPPHRVEPG